MPFGAAGGTARFSILAAGLLLVSPAAWAAGGDMPSLVHDIGLSLLVAGGAAGGHARDRSGGGADVHLLLPGRGL